MYSGRLKESNHKVYTHKFNGPWITYGIGIAIYKDCVLWIKGPVIHSTYDATIFQIGGGIHPDMPEGKRGIADSAYKALNEITVYREGHSK